MSSWPSWSERASCECVARTSDQSNYRPSQKRIESRQESTVIAWLIVASYNIKQKHTHGEHSAVTECILAGVSAGFISWWSETREKGPRQKAYVMYKKPSSSLCSSYMLLISAAVGGSTSSTKIKIAFSGDNLMRLRITYTNWPTVRSAGTRYFFLSMVAMSDFSTFSQMTCHNNHCQIQNKNKSLELEAQYAKELTGIRSAYF